MLKWKQIIASLGLLLFAFSAQADLVPCGPGVPKVDNTGQVGWTPCSFCDFSTLLQNIYDFIMGLAALIALAFVIIAGVKMTVFYVSETPPQDLEAARRTLTRSIFGLVVVICSYLLINTIILVLTGKTIDDLIKPMIC